MERSPIWRADEWGGLRLRELYRSRGYLPYRMSKFEPYDLYLRNKSFLVSENILTFTDTDGRLMALKPDVTLSIVKNAQPPSGGLEKVYYHENVYRTTSVGLGFREIMQTGLECIGDLDLAAMGEVLSLAAESLGLLGGGAYLLDLGHMGLVSGLLEQVREENVRERLLAELGRKNTAALSQLCAQAGVERDLAERLCRLAQLYGPPDRILPQLKELAAGSQAKESLEELEGLCRVMAHLHLADSLRLDFSIANDMRYYNGIIFRGYLPGLADTTTCSAAWAKPARPSGSRCTWINWNGWTRTANTTWICCCCMGRRRTPPLQRPGPRPWRRREKPSAWSGPSPGSCAGGSWSGSRKEDSRNGYAERRPAQGAAGREGIRPV